MKQKKSKNQKHFKVQNKLPASPHLMISKLSPKESFKMLKSARLDVTIEESEEIMDFLYILTEIALKEIFSEKDFIEH